MKRFSSLMIVLFILSACSNEPTTSNNSSEQPMPASQVSASDSPTISTPSMDLGYAAYRAVANNALRTAETGLSIPESVYSQIVTMVAREAIIIFQMACQSKFQQRLIIKLQRYGSFGIVMKIKQKQVSC